MLIMVRCRKQMSLDVCESAWGHLYDRMLVNLTDSVNSVLVLHAAVWNPQFHHIPGSGIASLRISSSNYFPSLMLYFFFPWPAPNKKPTVAPPRHPLLHGQRLWHHRWSRWPRHVFGTSVEKLVFGWLVGECCGQTIGWLMFVWLVGFSYVRTYFTKIELMYTIFEFGYFSLDFFCIEGDVEWKGCRFGGWVFFAMIRNRS